MTRLYFDTEFTGLHQNTTLISIGIISDTAKAFYGEFTDYDDLQIDDWIWKNVILKLKYVDSIFRTGSKSYQQINDGKRGVYEYETLLENQVPQNLMNGISDTSVYECAGDTKFVSERLKEWLSTFERCEMYGDVYAYDWVLFCELFGGARKVPSNICYIPQDLATALRQNGIDPDISRMEFSRVGTPMLHNSLADAWALKACFEKIESLKK